MPVSQYWRAFPACPLAPLWRRLRTGVFSAFGAGQFFFQLVDAVLHAGEAVVEQADIEVGDVLGRGIGSVALAKPGRVIDLDVFEAQLLKYAGRLRGARAALAIDDGFFFRIQF